LSPLNLSRLLEAEKRETAMTLNFIDVAKNYLTPDVILKLAGEAGETFAATGRVIRSEPWNRC
jgi:hypothetical protein